MNFIFRALLGGILPLYTSGGGGGDGGAADAERAAEASREALRQRINAMYGIDTAGTPGTPAGSGRFGSVMYSPGSPGVSGADARAQLEAERARLSGATESYYQDELGKDYTEAVRQNKFGLARRGLLGGSVEADTGASLQGDLNLGTTRVSDAARRAAAGLDTSREQQRLQAIQLANQGAGESAVSAASAGLRDSIANAESAGRTDLFGDLFSGGAIQSQQNSIANHDARLARLYGQQRPFSTPTLTTGRETASQ